MGGFRASKDMEQELTISKKYPSRATDTRQTYPATITCHVDQPLHGSWSDEDVVQIDRALVQLVYGGADMMWAQWKKANETKKRQSNQEFTITMKELSAYERPSTKGELQHFIASLGACWQWHWVSAAQSKKQKENEEDEEDDEQKYYRELKKGHKPKDPPKSAVLRARIQNIRLR